MEELTDLEICKKIAEIESIPNFDRYTRVVNGGGICTGYKYYNPIKDDGLCFQLMVKYEVEREYEPYDFIGWNYHSQKDKDQERITERTFWGEGEETPDISPNRAICLAIIKAH